MPNVANDFKKGTANFKLVGKVRISPNTFLIDKKSDSGFVSNKMYLGVECGNGNVVYAQMFGGYKPDKDDPETIITKLYLNGNKVDPNNPRRTIDDYDNKFDIDWGSRFNREILEMTGPSCFVQVGLQKDIKSGNLSVQKFLSPYDAISYIKEVLDSMPVEKKESLVVEVRGTIDYRYYEGKTNYQKTITSIKLKDDVTEDKYTAEFTQTIYADKDSIGKADTENLILPLTVKVPEYINKYKDIEVKETVPLDIEVQLDARAGIAKWLATNIKNSKGFARIVIIGNFIESGSAEEFNIDTLDKEVREALENGVITEEDIKMTVAAGNQRSQIMSINRLKVVRDENEKIVPAFESSIYTEKEMNEFSDKFFTIVNEMDNDNNSEEENDPTEDGSEEVPFNVGDDDEKAVDSMDWINNFK